MSIGIEEIVSGLSIDEVFERNSTVAINDNHLYVIGRGDHPSSRVYWASINHATGTQGDLGKIYQLNDFPVPIVYAKAIIIGDKLHVLGGMTKDGYNHKLYTATIEDDGCLTEWKETPLPMIISREASLVIVNNYLYVSGVTSGKEVTNMIIASPIEEDGTLGNWKVVCNLEHPISLLGPKSSGRELYGVHVDDNDNTIRVYLATPGSVTGEIDEFNRVVETGFLTPVFAAVIKHNTLFLIECKVNKDDDQVNNCHVYYVSLDRNSIFIDWRKVTLPITRLVDARLIGDANNPYLLTYTRDDSEKYTKIVKRLFRLNLDFVKGQ